VQVPSPNKQSVRMRRVFGRGLSRDRLIEVLVVLGAARDDLYLDDKADVRA
jgi:hypothetical protein